MTRNWWNQLSNWWPETGKIGLKLIIRNDDQKLVKSVGGISVELMTENWIKFDDQKLVKLVLHWWTVIDGIRIALMIRNW